MCENSATVRYEKYFSKKAYSILENRLLYLFLSVFTLKINDIGLFKMIKVLLFLSRLKHCFNRTIKSRDILNILMIIHRNLCKVIDGDIKKV